MGEVVTVGGGEGGGGGVVAGLTHCLTLTPCLVPHYEAVLTVQLWQGQTFTLDQQQFGICGFPLDAARHGRPGLITGRQTSLHRRLLGWDEVEVRGRTRSSQAQICLHCQGWVCWWWLVVVGLAWPQPPAVEVTLGLNLPPASSMISHSELNCQTASVIDQISWSSSQGPGEGKQISPGRGSPGDWRGETERREVRLLLLRCQVTASYWHDTTQSSLYSLYSLLSHIIIMIII